MIAIKGGHILTMDRSGSIDNGVVLIEDQRIHKVGKALKIPEGAQVLDATGKYVCPGFIDAHTHIGLEEEIYRIEGDDVNEISHPITPYLQAADGINFLDLAFTDAMRGGVTRTLCMPGSANILGGQGAFLKHLAPTPGEMLYRHPWGLKAALGENPKRVYGGLKKTPNTRMASASLLRESLATARSLIDKEDLKARETYRNSPLFRVLNQEMPLLVHVHRADDILTALRIKDEFGIDMILQHGTEAHLVAPELVKRQVPVCLGPLLVNRAKVEMKSVSFKNAARLADQGVEFCFITDHPVIPIEHLRVCAALAVREGLSEEQALRAITIWPAQILGAGVEMGSIAVGKLADMAIWDGHPFDFRSQVDTVLIEGCLWRNDHE
ncbi:MAG: amidohydrolase [Syntrophomonadaceae bacterium]|nr:amidohydrolase [Syntrophomonadaceae bacterium]